MKAKRHRSARLLAMPVVFVAYLAGTAVPWGATWARGVAATGNVVQWPLSVGDPAAGARKAGLGTDVNLAAARLASETLPPENAEGEGGANHELLYKVINFVILVGALAFLLRKPLAEFLAQRSESIRKSLEESRKALEASQAQLRAIEEKLRGLEEEISRFKAAAAQEMEAERERLRLAAAAEAERILQFAQAEIDNATRAAKLELKVYAARQAVELAETMIRQQLDEAGQRRLVGRFVRELTRKPL